MDVIPSQVRIYGYDFKVNTYTKKIKDCTNKNWSTYIKKIEYTKIRSDNLFTKRNFISTNSNWWEKP